MTASPLESCGHTSVAVNKGGGWGGAPLLPLFFLAGVFPGVLQNRGLQVRFLPGLFSLSRSLTFLVSPIGGTLT